MLPFGFIKTKRLKSFPLFLEVIEPIKIQRLNFLAIFLISITKESFCIVVNFFKRLFLSKEKTELTSGVMIRSAFNLIAFKMSFLTLLRFFSKLLSVRTCTQATLIQ